MVGAEGDMEACVDIPGCLSQVATSAVAFAMFRIFSTVSYGKHATFHWKSSCCQL